MDTRVERFARSLEAVDAHRRRNIRGAGKTLSAGKRKTEQRGRCLRAVDQRQPLFRGERDWRQSFASNRRGSGLSVARLEPGLSFADQDQREVREGRQIAARAHRPARGNDWVDPTVEQVDQQVERLEPDSREAFRQYVRPQRHRGAHNRNRQRFANARRVASEQVDLERLERIGRDPHVGEIAETGVDAVGRLVAVRELIDDAHAPRARAARAASANPTRSP